MPWAEGTQDTRRSRGSRALGVLAQLAGLGGLGAEAGGAAPRGAGVQSAGLPGDDLSSGDPPTSLHPAAAAWSQVPAHPREAPAEP